MSRPTWKLDTAGKASATLESDKLCGTIDLSQPGQGLTDIVAQNRPLSGWRLFAVHVPQNLDRCADSSSRAGQAVELVVPRLTDCYVRGTDLVAEYRVETRQPFDLSVCWRVVHNLPSQAVGLDVIPAVNTERLDSRPEIVLQSQATADSIWQLGSNGTWRQLPATGAEYRSLRFGDDTGSQSALLWHPAPTADAPAAFSVAGDAPLQKSSGQTDHTESSLVSAFPAYIEMVSPDDWPSISYRSQATRHEVRHRLFTMPLEKGVILRTRLRGIFFPTAADALRDGRQMYESLAAEPPPLTV